MWPDGAETQKLLKQAGEGAPRAVDALLERHRLALRSMVQARLDQRLARRVDASDIVQEVLIEANRRLVAYLQEPKLPFQQWLRQMAQDQIIDTHRRHRVAARRSMDREQPLNIPGLGEQSSMDLAAQIADQELTPAANAVRRELHRRFLEALEQMPDDDRELLIMRHVEQLSNSQVADILGLSQPAAGMRYLRALRRVREILGEASSPGGSTA